MYSEVLIAKYGGSGMNNACTISPTDFVSCPAKSYGRPHSFRKRKYFCMIFASAYSQLTCESAHG